MIARIALLTAATALSTVALAADKAGPNYDDPTFCSKHLKGHGDMSLTGDANRRCMIAISSTYVDAEENTKPPRTEFLADDISRHSLGTPPNYVTGNGAKIFGGGTSVIGAIRNRVWMVEGNQAWIVYDGYFKTDLDKPGFYVVERFTIEKGVIKEIFIAGVNRVKTP